MTTIPRRVQEFFAVRFAQMAAIEQAETWGAYVEVFERTLTEELESRLRTRGEEVPR